MNHQEPVHAFLFTAKQGEYSGWTVVVGQSPPIVGFSKNPQIKSLPLLLEALGEFHRYMPDELSQTQILLHISSGKEEVLDEEEILPSNVLLVTKGFTPRRRQKLHKAFTDGVANKAILSVALPVLNVLQRGIASESHLFGLSEEDVIVTVAASVPLRYDSGENFYGRAYCVVSRDTLSYNWDGRQLNGSMKKRKPRCSGPSAKTSLRPLDRSETMKDTLIALREALQLVLHSNAGEELDSLRVALIVDSADAFTLLTTNDPLEHHEKVKVQGVQELLDGARELFDQFPNIEIVSQENKECQPLTTMRELCKIGAELSKDEYLADNATGQIEALENAAEEAVENEVSKLSDWLQTVQE